MAKIPPQWRLSATILAESKERRVLVGDYLKGLLDHVILSITNLDVPEVVTSTSNGSLTAKQVAKHFARELHMHISWLVSSTSIFSNILMTSIQSDILLAIEFELALEQAQELDDYYEEHKRPIGPLHRVPFALKDQFHIKGFETTMVYVGWIGTFEGVKGTGKEKVFESELVGEFRSLGAIPIAKVCTML